MPKNNTEKFKLSELLQTIYSTKLSGRVYDDLAYTRYTLNKIEGKREFTDVYLQFSLQRGKNYGFLI